MDRHRLHSAGDPIAGGLLEENSKDLRVVRLVDVRVRDTLLGIFVGGLIWNEVRKQEAAGLNDSPNA
jgi:hypothetical protein